MTQGVHISFTTTKLEGRIAYDQTVSCLNYIPYSNSVNILSFTDGKRSWKFFTENFFDLLNSVFTVYVLHQHQKLVGEMQL